MKENEIEELILDYLDGSLEFNKLEEILKKTDQFRNKIDEIKKLKSLYSSLDEISVPEPGENLDKKFYNMLEPLKYVSDHDVKKENRISLLIKNLAGKLSIAKLGYALSFLVIGMIAGKWLFPSDNTQITQMAGEIKQMKEVMMFTMLNQPAPSERIKAVNQVYSLPEVDTKVINALLETLNNDPDVNVRLVTIDALSAYTQIPDVRQGLVQSINKQKSPLVQIALADLMVSIKEKNSIEPLKQLLANKDINHTVKTRIENCITKI